MNSNWKVTVTGADGKPMECPFMGPMTPELINSVLNANQLLLKLCLDLQNDSSPSARQELTLYPFQIKNVVYR